MSFLSFSLFLFRYGEDHALCLPYLSHLPHRTQPLGPMPDAQIIFIESKSAKRHQSKPRDARCPVIFCFYFSFRIRWVKSKAQGSCLRSGGEEGGGVKASFVLYSWLGLGLADLSICGRKDPRRA